MLDNHVSDKQFLQADSRGIVKKLTLRSDGPWFARSASDPSVWFRLQGTRL